MRRAVVRLLLCTLGAGAVAMAAAAAEPEAADDDTLVIVAVTDAPQAVPGVGSTPRADYRRGQDYGGGSRSVATGAAIARDFGLTEQKAWTIVPLRWRCMLLRAPPGTDVGALLAALQKDARVQLAQPLNRFETLQSAAPRAEAAPSAAYNDPYVGLQRGFAAVGAAEAQRHSQGAGVRVALIDSGVDASHPELAGRVDAQRDFAAAGHPLPAGASGERHGTAVAGVIAAAAHNGLGIVGIAPQARLLAYRACWALPGSETAAAGAASRCDSFTLAQALGAAVSANADIINLSLGGPADALLARLAGLAMQRGAIVVGAMPASGRREGFPAGLPGVVVVASSDEPAPAGGAEPVALAAPGRDILTLTPGGHYDYASGSSLAAAHVSGGLALLRALKPRLGSEEAQRWLSPAAGNATAVQAAVQRPALLPPVDLCAAVRQVRPSAVCADASRPPF